MRTFLVAMLIMLCGCRKEQPPAPTAEQSNQLNESENMLNELAANESANSI